MYDWFEINLWSPKNLWQLPNHSGEIVFHSKLIHYYKRRRPILMTSASNFFRLTSTCLEMADRPVTAAVGTAQQGQGLVKRFFELIIMLVIFAWGEASKAKDEAASLRGELRLARSEQADRQGTQCNVCLDNPRETVLQPCGHVCMCLQCATRVQQGEKQCPVCRARIEKVSQAYISWWSIQCLSENIFETLKTLW